MYGREFLSVAQTTKCRIAEEDNDVFMGTLLKDTAFAGTVPTSFPGNTYISHISSPLQRNH